MDATRKAAIRICERADTAFTLIELVVMICLLAMLGAMLVPALARTRPNVKADQCLNNLKQWGAAQYMSASENSDAMACDGMGDSGTYMGGNTVPLSGTPDDPYAWFNVVPPYLAEKSLSNYYHLPAGDPRNKMPFPGRTNSSQIWHCPSATMSDSDYAVLQGGGTGGFFSYADNTDLKTRSIGGRYPTWMPKLAALPKPSATVLMFDAAFNPVTELVNGSPGYNSVNPANRYRSIGIRHDSGPMVGFCDGHVRHFKFAGITNTAAGTTPSGEPRNPAIIWSWIDRQQYP